MKTRVDLSSCRREKPSSFQPVAKPTGHRTHPELLLFFFSRRSLSFLGTHLELNCTACWGAPVKIAPEKSPPLSWAQVSEMKWSLFLFLWERRKGEEAPQKPQAGRRIHANTQTMLGKEGTGKKTSNNLFPPTSKKCCTVQVKLRVFQGSFSEHKRAYIQSTHLPVSLAKNYHHMNLL